MICDSLSSALLLVALLTGLAGCVLLLLTGLGLPALLLLLPRSRLTPTLLLAGLLVGSLRRLRSMIRIIHFEYLVRLSFNATYLTIIVSIARL
jgi:hypothetical protein